VKENAAGGREMGFAQDLSDAHNSHINFLREYLDSGITDPDMERRYEQELRELRQRRAEVQEANGRIEERNRQFELKQQAEQLEERRVAHARRVWFWIAVIGVVGYVVLHFVVKYW
jgi:hypothetical protein